MTYFPVLKEDSEYEQTLDLAGEAVPGGQVLHAGDSARLHLPENAGYDAGRAT